MKFLRLSFLAHLSAFLLFFSHSFGAEEKTSTDDLINNLQSAVDQLARSQKDKAKEAPQVSMSDPSLYVGRWTQSVRQAIARGDLNSLQESLRQIQAVFPDENIQKISEELLTRAQDEIVTKEKNFVETVDRTVDQAVQKSFSAKSPKELDSSILELSRMAQRPGDYSNSELVRRTSEKARSAVAYLCQWQDYLAQSQSGNTAAAQTVLRSISQNISAYSFVSRSEVLSRMGPESSADGVVKLPDLTGKTLKDLDSLYNETASLIEKYPNQNELRRFGGNLDSVRRAQSDFESGLIGKTFYFCTNQSDSSRPGLAPFRQELMMEVLPVYLNVAKIYPAQKSENPSEYLLRVIKEAKAKGDWATVWKTLETYRNVSFSSGQAPGWLAADIQGCSNFISAQNFEKAGQYADAVRYYKRVLSQPGENLPADETTARLNALQKEHPDDYNAATTGIPPSNRDSYPQR